MKESFWFVYIIENERGHYYTGITTDLERRMREHSEGKRGAKFFRTGAAVKMVFRKRVADRSAASRLEALIKKMTRRKKAELVTTKKVPC